jgi:hypothetical protein
MTVMRRVGNRSAQLHRRALAYGFGVVDFPVGEIKVNVGLGYGFTAGSDRLVAKTFWEYPARVGTLRKLTRQ